MEAETILKPLGIEKTYPTYKVVLVNDDFNSFEHVIRSLVKYIPKMSPEEAEKVAVVVHTQGSSVVYEGNQEMAELFYEQLKQQKLTVKLEKK